MPQMMPIAWIQMAIIILTTMSLVASMLFFSLNNKMNTTLIKKPLNTPLWPW